MQFSFSLCPVGDMSFKIKKKHCGGFVRSELSLLPSDIQLAISLLFLSFMGIVMLVLFYFILDPPAELLTSGFSFIHGKKTVDERLLNKEPETTKLRAKGKLQFVSPNRTKSWLPFFLIRVSTLKPFQRPFAKL